MDFSEASWLRPSRPPTGRSTTELLDLAAFAARSRLLAESIAAEDARAVIRKSQLPEDLTKGVEFLLGVYRGRKRKVMQAPALLHPLRASMVVREIAVPAPPGAAAAALFHDYVEDTAGAADEAFFAGLGLPNAKEVARWVDHLTRRGDESYVAHISRVCTDRTAIVLKAADAIDNLLDLRAAPESVADEVDLRQAFAQAAVSPMVREQHPPTPRIRGEARLYATWKCFSLINLAHRAALSPFAGEDACRRAGQRECLRIAIHLIRYHVEEGERARLLEQHARYCRSPDITRITPPRPDQSGPDGLSLLMMRRSEHKGSLENFYADKTAMLLSTLALLEIFNRLRDPRFSVAGLEAM
ncbi:MAG: hypothetical protein HY905_12245 [Deltaproteobacteria bacterium]|nr:hypothetical protein [Deltaproteobacteria bacterium]